MEIECFSHTTLRGEKRIVFRFASRPESGTLAKLKAHSATYRKFGHGQRSAWFLPTENVASLAQDLTADHPLTTLLLLEQHVEQTEIVEEAADAEVDGEVEGTGRAPKRQRRSGRIPPPPTCFACVFEVKELRRCGRFVEAPLPHDCGF